MQQKVFMIGLSEVDKKIVICTCILLKHHIDKIQIRQFVHNISLKQAHITDRAKITYVHVLGAKKA